MTDFEATSEQDSRNVVTDLPERQYFPIISQPYFDYRLPIPSPSIYTDYYHHPLFPQVISPINCFADPINRPFAFPEPIGPLTANCYDILGVRLHDFGYVNFNPSRLFLKYMLWFLEINDDLFGKICPSDLNDMPCEWDELQGGCPMLRLCEMRHKYMHPHLGEIPACKPEFLFKCRYIHNIDPTCRSIAKQLRQPQEEQFRHGQLCEEVAEGRFCKFGHDFESARVEAARGYWKHREGARMRGSVGWVKRDVRGRKLLKAVWPEEEQEY